MGMSSLNAKSLGQNKILTKRIKVLVIIERESTRNARGWSHRIAVRVYFTNLDTEKKISSFFTIEVDHFVILYPVSRDFSLYLSPSKSLDYRVHRRSII